MPNKEIKTTETMTMKEQSYAHALDKLYTELDKIDPMSNEFTEIMNRIDFLEKQKDEKSELLNQEYLELRNAKLKSEIHKKDWSSIVVPVSTALIGAFTTLGAVLLSTSYERHDGIMNRTADKVVSKGIDGGIKY